jgi:hypothetical protein
LLQSFQSSDLDIDSTILLASFVLHEGRRFGTHVIRDKVVGKREKRLVSAGIEPRFMRLQYVKINK